MDIYLKKLKYNLPLPLKVNMCHLLMTATYGYVPRASRRFLTALIVSKIRSKKTSLYVSELYKSILNKYEFLQSLPCKKKMIIYMKIVDKPIKGTFSFLNKPIESKLG